MPDLTRRTFLIASALFAPAARAVARPGRPTAAPISLDTFMRLSQRLVGRSALDAEVGRVYLDSLIAVPENVQVLARLTGGAAATTAEEAALERTIVECWYTGIYMLGGERRVATHFGALMWMASGAPAPGLCATTFGAWSEPPRRLG